MTLIKKKDWQQYGYRFVSCKLISIDVKYKSTRTDSHWNSIQRLLQPLNTSQLQLLNK